MLTLSLDPTNEFANPAFRDATSCTQWLGQLQLTNLHQVHSLLRAQLDEFNNYPLNGLGRLQTLESLRETMSDVQSDYAQKLVAKKLPLNDQEKAILLSIVGLWQGMINGYLRCMQSLVAGDIQLMEHGALIGQRCLLYSGFQISEYMRAGYEFDGKLWYQLHQLYVFCEEQGWPLKEVRDDLHVGNFSTSCNATYSKILLSCHAHRGELSRLFRDLTGRWLNLWSRDVVVAKQHTPVSGEIPTMAVDLESEHGLQLPQLISSSDHARYLLVEPLSKLIRAKVLSLQQGQSPQQLDLGENCNSPECVVLLNYLHQCWCEGRDSRLAARRGVALHAHVSYGMESCYSYIANKPFRQPVDNLALDGKSRLQISAFGQVISETSHHDLMALGFVLETWQIENESMRGSRLLRIEDSNLRLGPSQLIAIRPDDTNAFIAGVLSWVKVTKEEKLHIGVRYLPGLPQAVSMKGTGVNLTISDKYVPALIFPDMPAFKIATSLVIPRDWFKPGRVVEILYSDNQKSELKMLASIEKGADFERISFSEIK